MNLYIPNLLHYQSVKDFGYISRGIPDRPKDLGVLIVVGGPGGSGSSTIARLLAKHYGLSYFYGGGEMRKLAKKYGFDSLTKFLASEKVTNPNNSIDREIDERLIKAAFSRNVLIDSKNFAAIVTYKKIPTTIRIWLTADLEVRVHRKLWSKGRLAEGKQLTKRSKLYKETSMKLMQRYSNDKHRFKKLYDIDYDKQEKYNDIILDTSKINVSETFNLLLKIIKHGQFIK